MENENQNQGSNTDGNFDREDNILDSLLSDEKPENVTANEVNNNEINGNGSSNNESNNEEVKPKEEKTEEEKAEVTETEKSEVTTDNKKSDITQENTEGKRTAKKKKKQPKGNDTLKAGIMAFCTLAVAGVLTFGLYWYNPSKITQRALDKTFTVALQRPNFITSVAENGRTMLDKKAFKLTATGTIKDNTVSEKFNGIGGKIVANANSENKTASAKISATYEGAEIIDADVYTDNDIIQLAMPAVMDKVLQINAENVLTQYANSDLCEDKENVDTENDFSLKLFGDENGEADIQSTLSVIDNTKNAWNSEFDKIKSNISISRSGSKTININGEDKVCKGFEMVIPGSDAKELVMNTVTTTVQDETFKAVMKTACTAVYKQNPMYSLFIGSADDFYNIIDERMNTIIQSVDTYMAFDDFRLNIFVYDGYVVSSVAATALSVGDDKVGLDFAFDFAGDKSVTDKINSSLTITSSDGTVVYTYEDKAVENNNVIENNVKISSKSGDNETSAEINVNYDNMNGDLTSTTEIKAGDETAMSLVVNGNMLADENGISAEFDEVTLVEYDDSLNLEGSIEIENLDEEISPLDGEVLKVFEDNSTEVTNEINAVSEKINSLFEKVKSKMG
jgi:hypothetical protein